MHSQHPPPRPWLRQPGNLHLAASLLGMYVWCMLLPLVGRAGSRTPHARENFLTVLAVLGLSLGFCAASLLRKRRADPSGPRPKGPLCLLSLQTLIGLLLLAGAFGV